MAASLARTIYAGVQVIGRLRWPFPNATATLPEALRALRALPLEAGHRVPRVVRQEVRLVRLVEPLAARRARPDRLRADHPVAPREVQAARKRVQLQSLPERLRVEPAPRRPAQQAALVSPVPVPVPLQRNPQRRLLPQA